MRCGETDKARAEAGALADIAPHSCVRALIAPLGFRDDRVKEDIATALRAAGVADGAPG